MNFMINMDNFFTFKSFFLNFVICVAGFLVQTTLSQRPIVAEHFYSDGYLLKLRDEVKELFYHAYDGYMKYAYPLDELQPLTCRGIDTWGSYSLTLIDALDTLIVMGNKTEFQNVVDILSERKDFDADINVSVFETNIRVVGGLLSAHLLSHKAGLDLEPGWPCNGPLLRLAEDAAQRLLPAFNSTTGMPYGTVNLRHGVPQGETPVTCTAGVGTFVIEFGVLSRLTNNPAYEEAATRALNSLWKHRSNIGLLGNHINVESGQWIATDSGIGAAIDSYFEYLVKGSALLSKPDLMEMFIEHMGVINKYMRKDDWYFWVTMGKGAVTLPVFQNLEAYWPGLLSSIGQNADALKSIHNYHHVLKHLGFVPEMYDIQQADVRTQREGYPLRPELIESLMFLYRATGDKSLFAIGEDILRSIQHSTRTPCGYATVKDVRDHRLEDRMESFFLAETTKYLYLLFDPDNFIHGRGNSGKVHQVASRTCILDSGAYIFNTEAHPIDAGALDCCHGPTDDEIWQSVWFPQNVVDTTTDRSREDLDNGTVQQEGPTILKSRSVNWVDVFLVGTNTKMCASFEIPKNTASINKGNRRKEVIKRKKKKGSKEAFQYSMLTCSAAHFNEKLCIGGEVCDF